jgi:uncharacterized iron-regulated protein
MRLLRLLIPALFLVACGGPATVPASPGALVLPESTTVLDAGTGAPISTAELVRRTRSADLVLLGEIHDNPAHHAARGALLEANAARKPAVVFEQLAWTGGPTAPPAAGESEEAWLDAHGFDRKSWKWPLHKPVVDAALAVAASLWGSNLPRETLRPVVREGVGAGPSELARLATEVPLDSVARAAIDQELFEGHCGKLPAEMVPGMRAAQEVRDAAMTEAMLGASRGGPAWLIAGDGHVRMDMGVPRLLRRLAPEKQLLVVGFVERGTEEAKPGPSAARRYQILVVTPPAAREDPCAGL